MNPWGLVVNETEYQTLMPLLEKIFSPWSLHIYVDVTYSVQPLGLS